MAKNTGGGLESLRFDVVLDYQKFNEGIDYLNKRADELQKRLTAVVDLSKNVSTKQIISAKSVENAKAMSQHLDNIAKKIESMPKGSYLVGDADKLNTTLGEIQKRLDSIIEKKQKSADKTKEESNNTNALNSKLVTTSSLLRTISSLTGVAFGAIGIRRFLSSLIDITGQFEVQRMALRNMLQDIDAADKIYQDLYRFSSESTYRFSELAKYAKQLAAFNIPKEDLLETTKMLGDVASGVGVSMDRIILAYGHVKSSGFLRGIQLRSFSQNGVPVLEELSKILTEVEGKTVSLGDVFDKMMRRQIPFEMVEQAFKNMTSEGGKFYQMQEVLAKTLAGQINILKGRWENMLAALGEANSGILKDTVSSVSNLISSLDNVGRLAKQMVVAFGAYATGMAIAKIAADTFGMTVLNAGAALEKFYLKLINNPYALFAAAFAAASVAVARAIMYVSEFDKINKTAKKSINDFNAAVDKEIGELDALYASLKFAKEGTEDYASAKNALVGRFAPYIDELRAEGKEVDDLAKLYENLTVKIHDSAVARFRESSTKDINDAYGAATGKIQGAFSKLVEDISKSLGRALTATEREGVWRYITGGINESNKGLWAQVKSSLGNSLNGFARGTYLFDLLEFTNMGMGNGTIGHTIEVAASAWKNATDEFKASMKEANEAIKAWDNSQKKSGHVPFTDWRRDVQEALYTLNQKYENTFMPKEDEDYFEYLERMGKHYKEVNEYKDKALEKDKKIYENELDAIRKIDQALEGNILKDSRYTKTPWNGSEGSGGKSQAQLTIENEIRLLEKFKSAYDRLLPFVGEENIGKVLKSLFDPTGENGYTFENIDERIITLADSLEQFGEKAKLAGEQIKASLGLDNASLMEKAMKKEAKAAEDAEKALNKYLEALGKWANATQELSGTGAEYGISNAIAKYKKAIGGNDMKFWEMAVLGTNAYKNDPTKQAGEVGGLMNLWAQNRANALATLRQDILKYTDDIFKEQMHKGGFDLTNLNDKTLPQLLAIKKAIESIEVPQAVRDMLNASGDEGKDLLKRLEEAIEEYKKNYQANTLNPELLGKAAKMAKYAAKEILSMADSIGKLNEEAGEAVGKLGDFASTVAQGFAQGNVYGAAISAVGWLAKQVIEGIAETDKFATEIEQKRLDAAFAYKSALNDIAANSKNTIFGENSIGKLREYIRISKEYKDELEPFLNEFGFLGYDSNNVEKILADIEGGLISGDGAERLKSVITKYKDALEQLDSIAEGVFGDVAQSAADKIVEGWIEAGDAALDYADILDDVAKAYSKMLIQSMISETFLDPITEDVKKAFTENRYEDAMAMIAGAMDGIAESAPMFEDILRAFDPYFSSGDSDANSLGSGIKSITEETASLLASYINAMRADLSYMRGLQERGWGFVELIGQNIPTLSEYLAQIAATNFDIAQSNQSILAEIQSVIGAEGSSGSIVRVQLA